LTGVDSFTCCQPDADSPVDTAEATRLPSAVHTLTRCVLTSPGILRNRTASTAPATVDLNRRPSSTGCRSGSGWTCDVSTPVKNE